MPELMREVKPDNWYIDKWFVDDVTFHHLYPLEIKKLAKEHWTPLKVAQSAAEFLVTGKGAKVLDIGCGVGKFCLAAAHFNPGGVFYGIEQRKELLDHANIAKNQLDLGNVNFIHGNFTQVNFRKFDHFYFFNSFYENIEGSTKIDHNIEYSQSLFNYYNKYLYKQLEKMPAGTRIVTYYTIEDQLPPSYYVVQTLFDKQLKFWVKV